MFKVIVDLVLGVVIVVVYYMCKVDSVDFFDVVFGI